MQVILLQDVKSLGKKGDLVKTSDGHARNYLLPKKLGVEATKKNLNDLKIQKANEEKHRQEVLADARALAAKLSGLSITLPMKMGEGGRSFGSISTKEVAEEAKKQIGLDLDRKKMQLAKPIKELGEYVVPIKLHPEVSAELKVIVESAN